MKEPVPLQLELIAQEIIVPLISVFHRFVEELCIQNKAEMDAEKSLLIMTKCIYYAVSITFSRYLRQRIFVFHWLHFIIVNKTFVFKVQTKTNC